MKKILGIVAASFLAASSASAGALDGIELSAKLNAGFATGATYFEMGNNIGGTAACSGFEIYPALVVLPAVTKFEGYPFDVSFEASVDMFFGSGNYYNDYKSTVITPGISALWNYHFENSSSDFLRKLTPYAGIQFSVPIQMTSFTISETVNEHGSYGQVTSSRVEDKNYSSTKVGFGMGFTAGVRYAFTEKIEADLEMGYNILSFSNYFIRAGVVYRFK